MFQLKLMKMMTSYKTLFVLILISSNCKPIVSATFENVSVILKWRSGIRDNKIVTVLKDDYLRNYVGEFGEVILQNQNVPRLTWNSVSNLLKVTHLRLINCKIKEIQVEALVNLPVLKDLDLSGNLLERLDNGIFDNLNFETLYLENNKIRIVGESVFNNLKMEYLFIDDNRISEWNSEWFRGTPLKSISMRNNLIRKVNRLAFEYLWHFGRDIILENFILSGNRVSEIDPDAFEGVKLIYTLNFENNSIRHLEPGLFDSVQQIDLADFSKNKLTEVYYETFRRTKLKELNIYDNFLTCISTDIFNATELEILDVGRNPITCDCIKTWQQWETMGSKPEFKNFPQLEDHCRSSASTISNTIAIFIFFSYLIT